MDVKGWYKRYILNTYSRVGPVFYRGQGSFLWDEEGRKFIDLFPGWGVNILGHAHPQIAKVLASQAKRLVHIPNNLYHRWQAELARKIIENSFRGKVFFANSGAEAVEAGLKLSRVYGRIYKKPEIICMENSFHGRTLGALSCTAQKKYQEPFRPLLSGIKVVKFSDFEDFKRKVSKKTGAVILEPIQGEAGVNIASSEYLLKLREFCNREKILLIFDEVQTGMGRTGRLFCFQRFGVKPDLFTLSKGLGGGFPISCLVVGRRFSSLLTPGMHASTFGGSPLACRVSLEVFKIIEKEGLLKKVRENETLIRKIFKGWQKKFKIIKEVRGLGLMWAIELKFARADYLFKKALQEKVIINATHNKVLRIMPALNIEKEVLIEGLFRLEKVLTSLS